MRVLGIDPGSRFLGYGAVEERGGRLSYVSHGVIRTEASAPLEDRLRHLFEELSRAVRAIGPDAVAVEGVFAFRNARSALVLGHARGVALLVAARSGLPVHEYAPARVKRAIGAGGRGDKHAVARMVSTFLGLRQLVRHDASDALAIAICHLSHRSSVPARTLRPRTKKGRALPMNLRPSYIGPPGRAVATAGEMARRPNGVAPPGKVGGAAPRAPGRLAPPGGARR
ncbi:MAG: crossover junction endodeoxyribonuclease RuvC [Myxococcales bacterium]|nr:crossover junction endodeoxyribonuclease RuvC [Myxococcales bacterium]